jgi:hypothetical protein
METHLTAKCILCALLNHAQLFIHESQFAGNISGGKMRILFYVDFRIFVLKSVTNRM